MPVSETLYGGSDEREEIEDVQVIEYRSIRMRSLRTLLGAALPTINWPWWLMALQGAIASAGASLYSMNLATRWLVYGIVFDLLTGAACTWLPEHKGPLSKLAPVTFARLVGLYLVLQLGKEPSLQFELAGYQTSWGEIFAIYFLTGIWSSAAKNMGYLGVKWPDPIMSALEKVHSSIDNADISSKLVSVFTSFTQKTDGNTQVISKTKTVVTETAPPVEKS